jgi:hypothetical protein
MVRAGLVGVGGWVIGAAFVELVCGLVVGHGSWVMVVMSDDDDDDDDDNDDAD